VFYHTDMWNAANIVTISYCRTAGGAGWLKTVLPCRHTAPDLVLHFTIFYTTATDKRSDVSNPTTPPLSLSLSSVVYMTILFDRQEGTQQRSDVQGGWDVTVLPVCLLHGCASQVLWYTVPGKWCSCVNLREGMVNSRPSCMILAKIISQDSRFSQHFFGGFRFYRIWHCLVGWVVPDILKNHNKCHLWPARKAQRQSRRIALFFL
jgi:hypothetical protein